MSKLLRQLLFVQNTLIVFIFCSPWVYGQPQSIIPAEEATHNINTLRDPTQPAKYEPGNKGNGGFQVRSIIIGKTRRVALINDTFVQIGDRIGSATVISIDKNSVVLQDAGRPITLYLFENDIRK